MSKTSYICNCDVIHEDIVNDVKSKMQPKDDYIQLVPITKSMNITVIGNITIPQTYQTLPQYL